MPQYSTRLSAPRLGTSFGITSTGHTEHSADAASLKHYPPQCYSGTLLSRMAKIRS